TDFILISGDLFNTSLPTIDRLKCVVKKLKEVRDEGIRIYVIAGSHDFSPSGKTMLDVLEHAGLFRNVVKGSVQDNRLRLVFTPDPTGAKITGMLGKRGMLERSYYESLDTESLEKEPGFKIFMFHSALAELKPAGYEQMEAAPLSLLPKGFSYYAGGHVHAVLRRNMKGHGEVCYPGPLFPNSFAELESLKQGGFYIVEVKDSALAISWEPIVLYNIVSIALDCSQKSPREVENDVRAAAATKVFYKTIVLLRLEGTLREGKPTDINVSLLFKEFYDKGAYFVMKNTRSMSSAILEEVHVRKSTAEEIEDALIDEHVGQIAVPGWDIGREKSFSHALLAALAEGKKEGERTVDFEERIRLELEQILGLKLD
ncbi:hypothetical protein COY95_05310, partial [Candidatus Woesearchaeota archaeon CG_4_10_14_0_8_um_filter_47_5]